MNNDILLRPELIFGPNPFIEAGAEYVPFDALAKRLGRKPLDAIPWQSFPPRLREPLLKDIDLHFAPHRNILHPAADLQSLFRAGLARRNPLLVDEKARTLRVAAALSRKDLLLCGQLDGGGGIWDGMTGTGKSALLKRVMEIISPSRVIPFGSSEVYGWDNLTHVPYLHIDFTTNGSRGGILKRVLFALDQLVGTSLSDDFRKVTNIDVLLVEVCRQLSNVRCVLLIIDEKQEQNFEDSPWKVEFLLFYLSLMNLGINVMLLGNPLAFMHLESFAQVMRRFSRAGHHHLTPAESANDPWWSADYMPRIRKFNVIDRWDIDPAKRAELEFEKSGGVPSLGAGIHLCAQIACLRRVGGNATEATATATDYEVAAESARFVEQQKIALAVRGEISPEAAPYLDVPNLGPATSGSGTSEDSGMSMLSGSSVSMVKSLLARFNAQQTRKSRLFVERLESLQGLAPEDLRLLGVEQTHVDELRKRAQETEGTAPNRKKAKPRN